MKPINLARVAFLTLVALVIICINAPSLRAQNAVVAEVATLSSNNDIGSTFVVDITIDVSDTDPAKLLGSFSASLAWDDNSLVLESHSGVKRPFTGVVNDSARSKLVFNGVHVTGSAGKSNILSATFRVIADNAAASVELTFSSMIAALDFSDLLPILTVSNGVVATNLEPVTDPGSIATDFVLEQSYPNPFRTSTRIGYAIPHEGSVQISVYDTLGRLVKTLVEARQPAGMYSIEWNGTDDAGRQLSNGVYFYEIKAAGFTQSRRMMLLR